MVHVWKDQKSLPRLQKKPTEPNNKIKTKSETNIDWNATAEPLERMGHDSGKQKNNAKRKRSCSAAIATCTDAAEWYVTR